MIPVFYTDAMVANAESFSPSAGKPKALVEYWLRKKRAIEVIAPNSATLEDLCRAHDPDFVRGVLGLRIPNGFDNCLAEVALSLPYTSGAMLSASRWSLKNKGFACAPCSGFHHAHYGAAGGYCTFNGLMVTALALKASGEINRIGILDFDQHYGDGTDQIIRKLGIDWIEHYTAGRHYKSASQAQEFLAKIPSFVDRMRNSDLILYQAGADPHVDDPLGGWLTTTQLADRDAAVFKAAAKLGLPVVWNLAGGYQDPLERVLQIHDNTLSASLSYAPRAGVQPDGPI
jgi:acetoin utilization deacetylase AcuC-like enzyme